MGRGRDSEDGIYFKDAYINKLLEAMDDIQYLIDRGYKLESAVRFAGNHYNLTARHNKLLIRAAATTKSMAAKAVKRLPKEDVTHQWLYIDGFNTLITIETMLCGGILYRSRDGCIRDLAGMGGSYRRIAETDQAIAALAAFCNQLPVKGITIYLDQPVSNSGNLKSHILSLREAFQCSLEVDIVRDPDVILSDKEYVVTTDTVILERCRSWFHLHDDLLLALRSRVAVDFNKEAYHG